MALEVKWTIRAKSNFERIVDYLEAEFGEKSAKAFVKRSYAIIGSLQEFPEIGSLELEVEGVRGILITRHNRLFYRMTNSQLILLSFFDTRQNPKSKIIK